MLMRLLANRLRRNGFAAGRRIVLAAMLAACTAAVAAPSRAETLRVGTECTYFPFNFRKPGGELAGYDIDVAREVARRIGADVEFVCQQWDGMIPALLAGKFDLIVASMSVTEERRRRIDFTDVLYRVSIGQFVGPASRDLALFDAAGEPNPAAFRGLRVGLQRASTYDRWLAAKVPSATAVRYDAIEQMYLDLKAGRIDVMMTNPMKTYIEFLSKPDGAGFRVIGPQLSEKQYFGDGVGIGLRQGQPELKARLDQALTAMLQDGTLERLGRQYFPFAIHPQEWTGAAAAPARSGS